jgi:hypothetical protein
VRSKHSLNPREPVVELPFTWRLIAATMTAQLLVRTTRHLFAISAATHSFASYFNRRSYPMINAPLSGASELAVKINLSRIGDIVR